MSFRRRLLLALLAAVALPTLLLAWWTETRFGDRILEAHREALEREARLVSEAVDEGTFSDSLAERMREVSGLRVTFVDAAGTVRGDSHRPVGAEPAAGDHAERPEIRESLAGRSGWSLRESETLARSFLYVAVPHPDGAVRVARPAEDVDQLPVELRRALAVFGSGALLLMLLVAGRAERFVAAPVRSLRSRVRGLASGDLPPEQWPRLEEKAPDEVGGLAGDLEALVDRLAEAQAERETVRDLAGLFDRLDDGIARVDGRGVVRRCNRAFRDWTGQAAAEGMKLELLFRDPAVSDLLERGIGGQKDSLEIPLGERTAMVTVRPHGEGAMVVLKDLTRLRKLEGVRRDFVANASHELKTPLTSVLGFAEALTDPDLPREQVVRFGQRILANGVRMRRLIDDLLDLSRIEGGAWEPDPERVDLEEEARTVWREMQGRAEARSVGLEIRVGGAREVMADREAVRQILRNLLDNALRYSPEGSRVRVASRPVDDGRLRIEVTDVGPGIPRAHQERIFERFYRLDPGRSRDDGGTGLGLSIVRNLVDAHGGEVGVESDVGEGATIWVQLPAPDG